MRNKQKLVASVSASLVPILSAILFLVTLDVGSEGHIGSATIPFITIVWGVPLSLLAGYFVVIPLAERGFLKGGQLLLRCTICVLIVLLAVIGLYNLLITNINLSIWLDLVLDQWVTAVIPALIYAVILWVVIKPNKSLKSDKKSDAL